jgi:hypothetical protein
MSFEAVWQGRRENPLVRVEKFKSSLPDQQQVCPFRRHR